jgi:alpha-beta hydrolase superfamily lysophospholipase
MAPPPGLPRQRRRRVVRRLLKLLGRLVAGALLVLATVVLLRAFDARSLGPLKPWHRVSPASEVRAAELDERFTLAQYLEREESVFEEVKDQVESAVAPEDRLSGNRYWSEGPLFPAHFHRNGNRTFELVPPEVKGGVLLLHGLTDAPYSMRVLARIYGDLGYHALVLRLPGHGTVPGALVDASWQDWAAAARVGARHVKSRLGPGMPFHVVGYSNGGALSLDYALDALEDDGVPKPDRLVLLSPMVGVARAAGFAKVLGLLGVFPYFETSRWLDVMPEYIPYKYVSFPVNAASQTAELTEVVRGKLTRLVERGDVAKLPPILTFVSLVDATVRTDATVRDLYDRLGKNGSALVVFDLNRNATVGPFLKRRDERLLDELLPRRARPWELAVVTNAGPETRDVVERRTAPGTDSASDRPLGLSWPDQLYSLSHVAVPFAPDDPLYGGVPPAPGAAFAFNLGTLQPRGERGVLAVPVEQLVRLTWNPFFPYLEERVRAWAALSVPAPSGTR